MHACMRDGPVLSVELDLDWYAAMSAAQWDVCIVLWVKDDDLQAMPEFVHVYDVSRQSLCSDDKVRSSDSIQGRHIGSTSSPSFSRPINADVRASVAPTVIRVSVCQSASIPDWAAECRATACIRHRHFTKASIVMSRLPTNLQLHWA